jgi:hypothetical protein
MTHIDELLSNPNSMRQWLTSGEGRKFAAWLKSLDESNNKRLRESSDTAELFRCQGRAEILAKMIGLPKIIEDFINKKTGGK